MEARNTLSPVQKDCLEATILSLKCFVSFLGSLETKLPPEDQLLAHNLLRLAELTEYRFTEAFPEVHEIPFASAKLTPCLSRDSPTRKLPSA
jgi:hypothetical protein